MEIPVWMSRTALLLEKEEIEKLMSSNVLVVGLGGVGGICAEMIARAGVGKMTIVDADKVEASNANRQIVALKSTEGKLKSEVLAERLRDINPTIELTVLSEFVDEKRVEEILLSNLFDCAVDCIDTLTSKAGFIRKCVENNVPIVSSMGAAGKLDPTKVSTADISKTFNCTLAHSVRKRLHVHGIKEGIQTVFSTEKPDKSKMTLTEDGPKKSILGTISYMPAIFGCTAASLVLKQLIKK